MEVLASILLAVWILLGDPRFKPSGIAAARIGHFTLIALFSLGYSTACATLGDRHYGDQGSAWVCFTASYVVLVGVVLLHAYFVARPRR